MAADGRSGRATLVAGATGPYSVALRDEHGLEDRPEPPRRVVVRADAPPVVAVRGGAEAQEARPDDVLAVAVSARDDVAVASVEVHYEIRRAGSAAEGPDPEAGHVAAPLDGIGTRTAEGEAALRLATLGLRPGDALSYRLRVADNRPSPRGPNVSWTEPRALAIVADAEPLQARRGRADREAIQEKLDAIRRAAAENRDEAEQLRYAADAAQRANGPWDRARQDALDRREAEARAVADRLQLLARELDDGARFRPLAAPARQVAEGDAEEGRALLDRALRDADPARRLDDLRRADARLAAVSDRLDDLRRQIDDLSLRDAELGDPPRQAAAPDRATADPGPADLAELKDIVLHKTGHAWGELPGHLRTEILQMAQGRYRDDYARLIQLYYREIAAGASGTGR